MANLFETSRRKIANAKQHIANLEGEIATFFKERPYSPFREPDPDEPKHEIHKLRFNRGLPDSFFNLTSDAVHNLRDSLDNAGYALAVAAGKSQPHYAAFPFAGSAVEFENGMRGRSKDIPEDIHAIFRAYKPYKGGNDFLWALSDLAVRDKHKLLTVTLNSELGNVSGTGAIRSIPVNPSWDSVKREIEVLTAVVGHPTKYHVEFAFFIAFDEVPVVSGEPVLDVLNYFVNIVEHILSALEAESRRLGFIS